MLSVLSTSKFPLISLFLFISVVLAGQDNYEIQVYQSATTKKGNTVLELHSNYTPVGNKQYSDKIFPSDKILHETIEITHGSTDAWIIKCILGRSFDF